MHIRVLQVCVTVNLWFYFQLSTFFRMLQIKGDISDNMSLSSIKFLFTFSVGELLYFLLS